MALRDECLESQEPWQIARSNRVRPIDLLVAAAFHQITEFLRSGSIRQYLYLCKTPKRTFQGTLDVEDCILQL